MSGIVSIILIVVIILLFALMVYGIRKEKSLSGFYKSINVCGRWYSWFTMDFILAGVGSLIALPVLIVLNVLGKLDKLSAEMGGSFSSIIITFVLAAAIFIPVGFLMFRHAYKKCPEELQKRLFIDMLAIFFGATLRLSLIFLMFIIKGWWVINAPVKYTVNGHTVYAFPGSDDLYDEDGKHVGKINPGGKDATIDDERYR
jgi:hypothetical protein